MRSTASAIASRIGPRMRPTTPKISTPPTSAMTVGYTRIDSPEPMSLTRTT
jgi:hypothetical protein